MNELISPEREYLERVYIDYLRKEYPSLEKFREYAGACFEQDQYCVEDRTLAWPRDIRTCLMSHMSFPDIIRLSRTDKRWRAIVVSASYNPYWRSRYRLDFNNYPLIGDGEIPFVEAVPISNPPEKKRKTAPANAQASLPKLKTVLWFEIFQYTWSRQIGRKFPLKRRSLRTFLEAKKRCCIPLPFPDIDFTGLFRLRERAFPREFFPEAILAMTNCTKISVFQIVQYICTEVRNNPQKFFVDDVTVAINQWGMSSDITVHNPQVVGTPVYNIFRPDCPLHSYYANIAAETKGAKCNVPLPTRLTTDWLLRQPLMALLTPQIEDVLRYYWDGILPSRDGHANGQRIQQ